MSKEAMKLALEALVGVWKGGFSFPHVDQIREAITAIREALAEQPAPMIRGDIRDGLVDDEPAQQEPVAYMNPQDMEKMKRFGRGSVAWATPTDFCTQPVYTSPPASKPLTDEQKTQQQEPVAWEYCEEIYAKGNPELNDYIRANGIPLYTSPQAQPTQRKPLTRKQLADAWIGTAHITHATERQIAYARAVEAAHGIKGDA